MAGMMRVVSIRSRWPAWIRSGFVRPFVSATARQLAPRRPAIAIRVSPDRTVYSRGPPVISVKTGHADPKDNAGIADPRIMTARYRLHEEGSMTHHDGMDVGRPGGSRARQGPRIVMSTIPRRTSRRFPTGARVCRRIAAGDAAAGSGAPIGPSRDSMGAEARGGEGIRTPGGVS